MAFIREFLKLTRFEHAIMLAIAVIIAQTIVLGSFPALSTVLFLSLAVPVFSEMASFAMNDALDEKSDRINKKMTPVVRGAISKEFAMNFAWVACAISIIAAFFINPQSLAIAIVFNLLAIAYNCGLKDMPLVGNAYIASTMAIPFIFGNFVVSGYLDNTIFVLALLGFVSGLAREIIKSVQDMEGDKKARKAKTLPIIIGAGNSVFIACFLYVLFIPLTVLPFTMFGMPQKLPAVVLVGIADAAILYMVFNLLAKGDARAFKQARNVSLIVLFLGLIGYLIAVL